MTISILLCQQFSFNSLFFIFIFISTLTRDIFMSVRIMTAVCHHFLLLHHLTLCVILRMLLINLNVISNLTFAPWILLLLLIRLFSSQLGLYFQAVILVKALRCFLLVYVRIPHLLQILLLSMFIGLPVLLVSMLLPSYHRRHSRLIIT